MISRRDFLAGSSLTLLGAAAPGAAPMASRATRRRNPGEPVVETDTTHGRVRGLQNGGIMVFKGIPYGASTAGRNRFMPPRPPKPWARPRDCLDYGQRCPQAPDALRSGEAEQSVTDASSAGVGEDCLNLDVWTPGLRDDARRPVLVDLQGGWGHHTARDGTQLALYGDVVVIGIHHRLGPLGYAQLADLGAPAEFAQAGVAGLIDLCAALRWVRDNVANFGGDAQRVMIFGQSAGGAHVSSLLATPAARGLFHRSAVQSGSLLHFETRERATMLAAAWLKTLAVKPTRLAELQTRPWQELLEAQVSLNAPALGARPVLDGSFLTHHPFDPAAPEESATVPLIVSSTLEDAAKGLGNVDLDESALRDVLDQRFAGRGTDLLALYRRYYPDKSPYLIQAQAFTDAGVRRAALQQAALKGAQGKGAIYVYQWDWAGVADDGRYGAQSGLDVSALFDDGREGDRARLGAQLSAAWVAFASTGNPACAALPPWPGYDPSTRATLVFGTPTQMVSDPRGAIREFWQHLPAVDVA